MSPNGPNRAGRGWALPLFAAGFLWCAAPEMETVWVHPDKGGPELYRDREACLGQAAVVRGSDESPYVGAVDGTLRFRDCMRERGWSREDRVVPEPE